MGTRSADSVRHTCNCHYNRQLHNLAFDTLAF